MNHSLIARIEQLRQQVTRLVWLSSFCAAVSLLLVIWVVLGLADWLLQRDEWIWRISFSALFYCSLIYVVWRWLRPAMSYRPSHAQLARKIESSIPSLENRVSTSVDLIQRQPPSEGGQVSSLARGLIESVTVEFSRVTASRFIRLSSVWTWVGICALLVLLTGLLFVAAPGLVKLGLARGIAPWHAAAWPKTNLIEFEPLPAAVARGESFTVFAGDANQKLDSGIILDLETPDNRRVRSFAMRPVAGAPWKYRLRLENIQRSFRLRASGGDHQTLWHDVQLIEAPKIKAISIQIIPPAVTGLPSTESLGPIVAWPGSQIAIAGHSDKSLNRATVFYDRNGQVSQFAATLADDKVSFRLPAEAGGFVCDHSGWFWITLSDRQQEFLQTPTRWPVKVVDDLPPRILVAGPESAARVGFEHVLGTRSVIEFSVEVVDELDIRVAIAEITGPAPNRFNIGLEPRTDPSQVETPFELSRAGKLRLDLNQFNLSAGDLITVVVRATDAAGQVGQSNPHQLQIVSEATLLNLLYQIQQRLQQSLASTMETQQRAIDMASLLQNSRNVPDRTKWNMEIRRLVKLQQNVLSQIEAQPDSLVEQIQQLNRFAETHSLRWPGQVAARSSQNRLTAARDDVAPAVKQQLTQLKSATPHQPSISISDKLVALRIEQSRLMQALSQSLESLKWNSDMHRVAASFRALHQRQLELADDGHALGRRQLLEPSIIEQDLAQLTSAQKSLRHDAEQNIQEIFSFDIQQSPRESANRVADASHLINQSAILATLATADRLLDQRQLGPANQTQHEIARLLWRLAESLDPTGEREADPSQRSRLIRQSFQDIERRLVELTRIIDQIRQQGSDWSLSQRAARRQQGDQLKADLLRAIHGLRKQIDESEYPATVKLLERAATAVEQSPASLRPTDLNDELKQLERALELLALARQELISPNRQPDRRVNLGELRMQLDRIIDEQDRVLAWTIQQHGKQMPEPSEADATIGQQIALTRQFGEIKPGLPPSRLTSWCIERIEAGFGESLAGLQQNQFGPATQHAQQSALAWLGQLAGALAATAETAATAPPQSTSDDAPAAPQAPVSAFEIALLYESQKQLHEDASNWLASFSAAGQMSDQLQMRLSEIQQRQQSLADIAAELSAKISTPPNDRQLPPVPDF